MSKKQKFKRGNLVHIAKDLGEFMSHFTNDVDAIIVGSYTDQFGGGDVDSYSVMFSETGGECSWYYEWQLTLINEGGEHLFVKARKNREQISKQNTDIDYIISKLDEGPWNTESILVLFDLIGVDTSFKTNGEFYVLYEDWSYLHPVFVHIKNSKTLEEAESIVNPEVSDKLELDIENVFNVFQKSLNNES